MYCIKSSFPLYCIKSSFPLYCIKSFNATPYCAHTRLKVADGCITTPMSASSRQLRSPSESPIITRTPSPPIALITSRLCSHPPQRLSSAPVATPCASYTSEEENTWPGSTFSAPCHTLSHRQFTIMSLYHDCETTYSDRARSCCKKYGAFSARSTSLPVSPTA